VTHSGPVCAQGSGRAGVDTSGGACALSSGPSRLSHSTLSCAMAHQLHGCMYDLVLSGCRIYEALQQQILDRETWALLPLYSRLPERTLGQVGCGLGCSNHVMAATDFTEIRSGYRKKGSQSAAHDSTPFCPRGPPFRPGCGSARGSMPPATWPSAPPRTPVPSWPKCLRISVGAQ
jgi:hypothetical protein